MASPCGFPANSWYQPPPRVEPSAFIQQLRHRTDKLRPTPAARHSSPVTFMHKDLKDSTHVWQDPIRCALVPP